MIRAKCRVRINKKEYKAGAEIPGKIKPADKEKLLKADAIEVIRSVEKASAEPEEPENTKGKEQETPVKS
ncbi:hypothetical protein [Limisalsivibrio acetivorans]|uniref:hypothetical protein n=1 Tax=Limisalsivibrio acetivorans TaxID=1304888 RepID=UPI0003B4650D|nr:hypothetical protein [Limisalsivibrio acetivorans]